MNRIVLLLMPLFLAFCLSSSGQQRQSPYYKIKSVYLPPEKRPAVRYSKDQLPFKGAGGELPEYDGQQFHLTLFHQQVRSMDEAKQTVTRFLTALQSPLKMESDIRMNVNVTIARPNQDFIEQQIKIAESSTQKRISGAYMGVSSAANNYIKETSASLRAQTNFQITTYRFDQYNNNILIDNTAINIVSRSGNDIVSLQGRFYNTVNITNNNSLSVDEASEKAVSALAKDNKFDKVTKQNEHATLVLLPYAEGFRYAWKTMVHADGPYKVWIDAGSGAVLQLLPDFFFSDNAKGLVFNPDPNAGTKEMTFEVDAPSGGKYTLGLAGFMTMSNAGADGTTGVVQVNDDGSGTANFNVSPINSTVVEKTSQTGYNGLFQQVNVYAHTFNERKYYELIGSQNFGTVNITVNQGGEDNAHPNSFFLCTATSAGGTACGNLYNTAIDATVVAHEFGHVLEGMQYGVGGGTMTGGINEGLSDFWACNTFNMTTVAGWTAHNCSGPTEGGWLPRLIDLHDVFPHHNSIGGDNEGHSAGQIIAWANYSGRQGMKDASDLGALIQNLNLVKAETTAGIGITDDGSDKSVHDSYLDLLKQIAPLYSSSRMINKLLAGYARAGIFLSPKDAVIDIDQSYLNRNSTSGPTFTVWTGKDYTFSGTSASTTSPPFNTQFMVEVANDENFTVNHINSGWLGGVVSGTGGSATWTLPGGNWTTLKAGDYLFFRVTTKDAGGGNIRQSWDPGNGFLTNVPVGKASINGTGTKDCGCTAAAATPYSSKALIPLLPLGYVFIRRRQLAKKRRLETKDN